MYEVKFTTAFKKSYRQMKKRGFDISQLDAVIDLLRQGKSWMRNTGPMACPGIGRASGNATSNRIGCWYISLKTMF